MERISTVLIYCQIFDKEFSLIMDEVNKYTQSEILAGVRKAHAAVTLNVETKSRSFTASLHKLAAGRKLAATHLNVSNRQMCICTGFKSGSYNKSYYNRPFKNGTGL